MRLGGITIKDLRNFNLLDEKLGEHAVVPGENKVGSTNLLFALRLILIPRCPSGRLRFDDFWDGLPRPLTTGDIIELSAEFRGFEKGENPPAALAVDLVKTDPTVARITYRYHPVGGLKGEPKSESDDVRSTFVTSSAIDELRVKL